MVVVERILMDRHAIRTELTEVAAQTTDIVGVLPSTVCLPMAARVAALNPAPRWPASLPQLKNPSSVFRPTQDQAAAEE